MAIGKARFVTASEFKANCLKIMDEVAASGGEVVITKDGRPVSRLLPYRAKPSLDFGRNKASIRTGSSIVEPMPAEWFMDDDDSEERLF